MVVKHYSSLDAAFRERIEDIESILSSYRTLHEIYTNIMKTANVNPNNLAAFKRLEKTANEQQKQISNKLHSQGLILLTGAAEALLKDAFEDLLTKNFVKVRSAKNINFTTIEIQEVLLKASDAQIPIESMSTQHISFIYRIFIDTTFKYLVNITRVIVFCHRLTFRWLLLPEWP